MAKQQKPIPITAIGHPHLHIYGLQILLFIAISLSIAYVVFTMIYGRPELANRIKDTVSPVQPVTADDVSAKKSINEQDFSSQSTAVDQQKLNNLFPQVK